MIVQRRFVATNDRKIRMAQIAPMDSLPIRPLINLRSFGWAFVSLMIIAGLLGLFTIGAA